VRTFEAQYAGRCACGCGGQIRPGDEVAYVDDELMLADCADSPASPTAAEAVCPSCWTVHRGECL
jgi:hypothetical protein